MGVDYDYANHAKKQYFGTGLFGRSCRFRNAGFSFGSRALSLLISHNGSWNGDPISMVDDVSDGGHLLSVEYVNISVEAELLILDVDGVEHFEGDDELDFTTFSKLCLYAMILRRPELLEFLDQKYGKGAWQKEYKAAYSGPSGMENALQKAQERNLVLYRK